MPVDEKKVSNDTPVQETKQVTVTFAADDINQVIQLLTQVTIPGGEAIKFGAALNVLQTKGILNQ